VSPVRYELGFYIPEDKILHRHHRENLKSYIALTGWTLQLRRNVSPVKYELGFYIPEDGILHSHRRDTPKSHILTVALIVVPLGEVYPDILRIAGSRYKWLVTAADTGLPGRANTSFFLPSHRHVANVVGLLKKRQI
jgi:hypothetical protein